MDLQKSFRVTVRSHRCGMRLGTLLLVLFVGLPAVNAQTQAISNEERLQFGTQPVKPFRIIGSIYYVGAVRVSAFLIKTPEGDILIDTGYKETAPVVRDSIEKLGFKLKDIKILLSSHAHQDHVGGHALIKELSGAKVLASEGDAPVIATGGRPTGANVVSIDGTIRDKQEVSLGGVKLTAHLTPGHTKGCTTWTMVAEEGGKKYNVVFMCSVNINEGYRLIGDPAYPNRAEDYRNAINRLKELPCDVFLGPHGFFFNLEEKVQRMEKGEAGNPFIDPAGYRAYVARAEKSYQDQLRLERAGQ